MNVELEDGERPPLPEDTVPSTSNPPTTDPVVAHTSMDATQSTALESNGPLLINGLISHSSDPPPLPPSEGSPPIEAAPALPESTEAAPAPPESIHVEPALLESTATAKAVQAASANADGAVTAPAAEASPGAASDDDDMEVDSQQSQDGTSGQPASAEASPSAATGQLPNWAGFYMAHQLAYPYYGKLHLAMQAYLCYCKQLWQFSSHLPRHAICIHTYTSRSYKHM